MKKITIVEITPEQKEEYKKLLRGQNQYKETPKEKPKPTPEQLAYMKLRPTEKLVAYAPIAAIISEKKLIDQKKSKASRKVRDVVILRYNYLVKTGKINPNE